MRLRTSWLLHVFDDAYCICRVTDFHFSFQVSLLFPYIGRQVAPAVQHCAVLVLIRIPDIGRCRKFGYLPFLYGTYLPADSNGKNGK